MVSKKRRHRIQQSTRELGTNAARYAGDALKVQRQPTPLVWMLICGFSALVPLLVGRLNHEMGLSIYGSLAGYFIALCDHRGTVKHRLAIATLAALTGGIGIGLGIFAQNSLAILILSTVLAAYPSALFGGKGAELERMVLFAGINFFVARYARSLVPSLVPRVGFYFFVAYATACLGILLSFWAYPKERQEFVHVKKAAAELLTRLPARHFYAITYTFALLLAIGVVEGLSLRRGYWVIITVLLLLKPDRRESLNRVVQRMFGTLLGVMLGELLVLAHPPILALTGGVFLCAAMVPYVWSRNYWLVSFFATNLVVCLLSIAQYGHIEDGLTLTRLKATAIGSLISLVVMFLARSVERLRGGPASYPQIQ